MKPTICLTSFVIPDHINRSVILDSVFFPAHVPRNWVSMAWIHDLSSFLQINDKTDLQIHNSYQCINFKLRSTNIPPVHLASCNTTLHFCPSVVLLSVLCFSSHFCCIFWICSFGNVQIGLLHQYNVRFFIIHQIFVLHRSFLLHLCDCCYLLRHVELLLLRWSSDVLPSPSPSFDECSSVVKCFRI